MTIVPRLKSDLEALLKLIDYDEPPKLPIQSSCPQATYVISGSSGTSFGTCIWTQGNKTVHVEFDWWTEKVELGESSNFREAANLVIKVIRMVKTSHIKEGSEVFVCTGNMVIKQTYTKGSSKSPKLHNLIIELRQLEMEGKLIIHFIWIAGTRMVAQGTDALSWGAILTSSMAVAQFLRLLPLDQTTFELQRNLRTQVEGWLVDDN